MGLKVIISALAVCTVLGLLAAPADAAPKKRVAVADARGATVYHSRDEDGRRRTRVIIQKRSYLDPGTEVFKGENSDHRYAYTPGHKATGVAAAERLQYAEPQHAIPAVLIAAKSE